MNATQLDLFPKTELETLHDEVATVRAEMANLRKGHAMLMGCEGVAFAAMNQAPELSFKLGLRRVVELLGAVNTTAFKHTM